VISAAYLSASLSSREVAIVDARPRPARTVLARTGTTAPHRLGHDPARLEEKALIGLFLALPALVLAAYGVRVAVVGRALDPRVQREVEHGALRPLSESRRSLGAARVAGQCHAAACRRTR